MPGRPHTPENQLRTDFFSYLAVNLCQGSIDIFWSEGANYGSRVLELKPAGAAGLENKQIFH
jgi:hypothetical protein